VEILALREAIASALTDHLGVYHLPNGATTAALSVRDPGDGMAAGMSVAGLEAVITSVPELEQRLQYSSSPFLQTWTLTLIDWGGGDIEGATALVQSGFPGTTTQVLGLTEDQGPKRQSQLRIPLSRVGGEFAYQLPPALQVQSVNGQTGHVVLGISDLDDVDPTGLGDDAVLVYDAAASKWRVNRQTVLSITDGGHW
jgi:hypothetical protein